MVKLVKKPPGYAGLASVYAYNGDEFESDDEPWISVAVDAAQGFSDNQGTLGGAAPDDNFYTGSGGASPERVRKKIAEEVVQLKKKENRARIRVAIIDSGIDAFHSDVGEIARAVDGCAHPDFR